MPFEGKTSYLSACYFQTPKHCGLSSVIVLFLYIFQTTICVFQNLQFRWYENQLIDKAGYQIKTTHHKIGIPTGRRSIKMWLNCLGGLFMNLGLILIVSRNANC